MPGAPGMRRVAATVFEQGKGGQGRPQSRELKATASSLQPTSLIEPCGFTPGSGDTPVAAGIECTCTPNAARAYSVSLTRTTSSALTRADLFTDTGIENTETISRWYPAYCASA